MTPSSYPEIPLSGEPGSCRLALEHQPQETEYWCGAAAVRMALLTRLGPAAPSQLVLAGEDNLQTERYGETPNRLVIRDTLNAHLRTARYRVRDVTDPPTAAERRRFGRDVLANISQGWPMVATFWARPAGPHPPGYPERGADGIMHIVTIYGYERGGATVLVADPVSGGAGVSWGAGVPACYRLSIETALALIGGKGYVA